MGFLATVSLEMMRRLSRRHRGQARLPQGFVLVDGEVLFVTPSSRASPLPQRDLYAHRTNVGAGLLAKNDNAVHQGFTLCGAAEYAH